MKPLITFACAVLGSIVLAASSFGSDAIIENSIIVGNTETDNGGAIHIESSDVVVRHNTIVGNKTDLVGGGGALTIDNNALPTIVNNIFWANKDGNNGNIDIQVVSGAPDVQVNVIQDGSYPTENFEFDPKFRTFDEANLENVDLRLELGSLAIDKGEPDHALGVDIDGEARNEQTDLGAYEAVTYQSIIAIKGLDTFKRYEVSVDNIRNSELVQTDGPIIAREGDTVSVSSTLLSVAGNDPEDLILSPFSTWVISDYTVGGQASGTNSLSFVVTDALADASSGKISVEASLSIDGAEEATITLGSGIDTRRRFIYDLKVEPLTPDHDFSQVRLSWDSVLSEDAPYSSRLNYIVRQVEGDQPLTDLDPSKTYVAGETEGNTYIVFAGSLVANSSLSGNLIDDASAVQGRYLYRVYTRLYGATAGGEDPLLLLGDEVPVDTTNAALDEDIAENLDDQSPVTPILIGQPGDGQALLSWSFQGAFTNADKDIEVDSITIFQDGVQLQSTANSSQRWYKAIGLTNDQSYTFSILAVDAAGNQTLSSPVTVIPRESVSGIFDVTGLVAAPGVTSVYLQWRYNLLAQKSQAEDADSEAIGFLIHRIEGNTAKLVGAVPAPKESQEHFFFVDDTTQANTSYTYEVVVIDRLNRQSQGITMAVETTDQATVEASLAVQHTEFPLNQSPVISSGNLLWTGSANGAIPGLVETATLPVDTNTVDESGTLVHVIPARDNAEQFYQALVDENGVFGVKFRLAVTGDNFTNAPVTIMQLKNRDSIATNGVVDVKVFQNKITIGDHEATFFHGGVAHTYTLLRTFDEYRLDIDGVQYALSAGTASEVIELGNSFIRFGAKSANESIETRWESLSFVSGVNDYFAMGDIGTDIHGPEPVTDLSAEGTSSPGIIKSQWTASTSNDVASYRVTVPGKQTYFVLGNESNPSFDLTVHLPLPHTVNVEAIDFAGNASDVVVSNEVTTNPVVSGSPETFASLADFGAPYWSQSTSGTMAETGNWISFTDGAFVETEDAFGLNDVWSMELTFAVSPHQDATGNYVMGKSTLLEITGEEIDGVTPVYSLVVHPDHITFSRKDSESSHIENIGGFYAGGSEHTLRFINTLNGLDIYLDGVHLETCVTAISLNDLKIGHLVASEKSTPNIRQLVTVVCGDNGFPSSAGMQPLTLGLEPVRVKELVIDEANSTSDATGATLAWQTPDSSVSVIQAEAIHAFIENYGTVTSDNVTTDHLAELSTERYLPAERLVNGAFQPTTQAIYPLNANPFEFLLKVTPLARRWQYDPATDSSSAVSGLGSARSMRFNHATSGGTVLPKTLIATQDVDPAYWTLSVAGDTSSDTLPIPSTVVPKPTISLGADAGLVVAGTVDPQTQVLLTSGSLIEDSYRFNFSSVNTNSSWTASSWDFKAYVSVGAFEGTLIKLKTDASTSAFDIVVKKNEDDKTVLDIQGQQHLINPNKIQLIELSYKHGGAANSTVTLKVNHNTVHFAGNEEIPFTFATALEFGKDATLEFGNMGYVLPAEEVPATRPTVWSGLHMACDANTYDSLFDTTTLSNVWSYQTSASITAPTVGEHESFGFTHIERSSEPLVLSYGDGSELSDTWTAVIEADVSKRPSVIRFKGPQKIVAVTLAPNDGAGGAVQHRIINTPGGVTYYRNGYLVTDAESIASYPVSAEDYSVQLSLGDESESYIVLREFTLVDGAIDSDHDAFYTYQGIFQTQTASIDADGYADPLKRKVVFAKTYLKPQTTTLNWEFDSENPASNQAIDINAQVSYEYTAGDYGITVTNANATPELETGSKQIVDAALPEGEVIAAPSQFFATSSATSVQVNWDHPDESQVTNYLLLLVDSTTGVITVDSDNIITPAQLPYTIDIPVANQGHDLELSVYAQKEANGELVARSTALTATIASDDTHSVNLTASRPNKTATSGDRMACLYLGVLPDDTEGLVLWQNEIGQPVDPAQATAAKLVVRLDANAIKRLDLIQANLASFTRLNGTHSSSLDDVLNASQDIRGAYYADLPVFFYLDGAETFEVPLHGVKNGASLADHYTFTLDPFDDPRPNSAVADPVPNMGSNEPGNNTIPVANANTVSLQVSPQNTPPRITGYTLSLSFASGSPLRTVGEVVNELIDPNDPNAGKVIPSWIVNTTPHNYVIVNQALQNDTLSFSGLEAKDRTLVDVKLLVQSTGSTSRVASEATRPFVDGDEDATDLNAPFVYLANERTVRSSLADAFLPSAVFKEGVNELVFSAADADGSTSYSPTIYNGNTSIYNGNTSWAVLYDTIGPEVDLLTPSGLDSGKIIVTGTYHDANGIKGVNVSIDGQQIDILEGKASVKNGAFWFDLGDDFLAGEHTILVEFIDLAGNSSLTNPVNVTHNTHQVQTFTYLSAPVTVTATAVLNGNRADVSADILGVNQPDLPTVETIRINNQLVTNPSLTAIANGVQLGAVSTYMHAGHNFFTVEVGVSLNNPGTVEHTFNGVARLYVNGEGPKLIGVTPSRTTPLYADAQGDLVMAGGTLQFDYFDVDPGVDPTKVVIEVKTDTATFTPVTGKFDITSTRAKLKATESITVKQAHPTFRLTIPEVGEIFTSNQLVTFTVLDAAQASQPAISALSPYVVGKGFATSVVLTGWNFDSLNKLTLHRADGTGIVALPLQAISLGGGTRPDTATVTFATPSSGLYYFTANGVLQSSVNATLISVNADSPAQVSAYLNSLTDSNNDGSINQSDLVADGETEPTVANLTAPSANVDRDLDTITDLYDQYPQEKNQAYLDVSTNAGNNLSTIGFTNASNSMAVVTPIVETIDGVEKAISGTSLLNMVALGRHDIVRADVYVGDLNGPHEVAALQPTTLFGSQQPVGIIAKNLPLSPDDNTILIRTTLLDGTKEDLTFTVHYDADVPEVNFTFMNTSHTGQEEQDNQVLGYHSLYTSLPVKRTDLSTNNVSTVSMNNTQYTFSGTVSDLQLDSTSFELRLDNRIVTGDELQLETYREGGKDYLNFHILSGKRLNIHDRWAGTPAASLVGLDNMLYGVHRVTVLASDKSGRTQSITRVFNFDQGEPVTIETNHSATQQGDPLPESEVAPLTEDYAKTKQSIEDAIKAEGLYAGVWTHGTAIEPIFTAGGSTDYSLFANGFDEDDTLSTTQTGPISLSLKDGQTFSGGAIEQLFLAGESTVYSSAMKMPTVAASTTIEGVTSSLADLGGGISQQSSQRKHATFTVTIENNIAKLDLTDAPILDVAYEVPMGLSTVISYVGDVFTSEATADVTNTITVDYSGLQADAVEVTDVPTPAPGDGGGGGGGGGSGGGGGYSGGSSSGNGGNGVTGTGAAPVQLIERIATLTPAGTTKVIVGEAVPYTLTVTEGDFGPTTEGDGASSSSDLSITGSGLSELSEGTHQSTITTLFPSLSTANETDEHADGYYYYNLQWAKEIDLLVEGIAIDTDLASLDHQDVKHQFVAVSQPFMQFTLLDNTIAVKPKSSGEGSQIEFSVLIRDEVIDYVPSPAQAAPQLYLNGALTTQQSATVSYIAPGNSGLTDEEGEPILTPRVFRADVRADVQYGKNVLNLVARDILGRTTRLSYTVDIGDRDSLRSTTNDLYLKSDATVRLQNTQTTVVNPLRVFGEFANEQRTLTMTGSQTTSMTLHRVSPDSTFERRFERAFVVVDDHPIEGTINAPSGELQMPIAIQNPGGTVNVTAGNTVEVHVEGVSFEQNSAPTHRIIYEDTGLAAYLSDERAGALASTDFTLTLETASGAAIPLNIPGNATTITIPGVSAGDHFGDLGVKYVANYPIKVVSDLPGGVRYQFNNNEHHIALHMDEYIRVKFGDLISYAQRQPGAPQAEFEAVTGVTPSSGYNIPSTWMNVTPEVMFHSRQLKVTHANFSIPGRRIPFGLSQTYRSGSRGGAALGPGWHGSWEMYFYPSDTDDDVMVYHGADGREDDFVIAADDRLIPPAGYNLLATTNNDGAAQAGDITKITLTYTDGSEATFTSAAGHVVLRIRSFKDRYGNTITYKYDANDRISQIVDDLDRAYTFQFTDNTDDTGGQARLRSIGDFQDLDYVYGYNDRGQLTTVTAKGKPQSVEDATHVITYRYGASGLRNLLGIKVNAQSYDFFSAQYDNVDSYQVTDITLGDTAGTNESVTETFVTGGTSDNELTHTDANGVVTKYVFSTNAGQTMLCESEHIDPTGLNLTTATTYTTELLPDVVTQPMKNTVDYDYLAIASPTDRRGSQRITETTYDKGARANPNGGEGATSVESLRTSTEYHDATVYFQAKNTTAMDGTVTEYKYGNPAKSLRVILNPNMQAGQDKTLLGYNDKGQTRVKITPDGGLTIYDYYQTNDLYENVEDLEGFLYRTITADVPGVADISTMDETTDLSIYTEQTIDALNGAEKYSYYTGHDLYGRVIASTTAKQATTMQVYNIFGQLTDVVHPPEQLGDENSREKAEYHYYDNGLLHKRITHNPVATGVDIANYNYVVDTQTSVYDALGRIVTHTRPIQGDTGVTTYAYEPGKMRLAYVKQPNDAYHHTLYDAVGRAHEGISHHDTADANSPLVIPAVKQRQVFNANGATTDTYVTYGGNATEFHESEVRLDWMDRVVYSKSVVSGRYSTTHYDDKGRVSKSETRDALGNTAVASTPGYDANSGILKSMTDVSGATTVTDINNATNEVTTTVSTGEIITSTSNAVGQGIKSKLTAPKAEAPGTTVEVHSRTAFDKDSNPLKSAISAVEANAINVLNNIGGVEIKPELREYNFRGKVTKVDRPSLIKNGDVPSITIKPSGQGAPGATRDEIDVDTINKLDEKAAIKETTEDATGADIRTTANKAYRDTRKTLILRGNDVTLYEYDLKGRLIKTSFYYNESIAPGANTLAQVEASLGAPESFEAVSYDYLGRVETVTRRDGSVLEYAYYSRNAPTANDRDRLHSITLNDDMMRYFGDYNTFGKPKTLIEFNRNAGTVYRVVLNHTYVGEDLANAGPGYGQLKQEIITVYTGETGDTPVANASSTVSYAYDLSGRRTRLTYPNGDYLVYKYQDGTKLALIAKYDSGENFKKVIAHYDYNDDYRSLKSANYQSDSKDDGANPAVSIERDYQSHELGLIKSMKFGIHYLSTFDYDKRGLKESTGQWVNTATTYTRDYTYDGLRRERGATMFATDKFATEALPLDEFENAQDNTVIDGKTINYALNINKRNQYTSITDANKASSMRGAVTNHPGGTYGVSYDNRGNMTSDGHFAYDWDAFDRLQTATDNMYTNTGAPQSVDYIYDALGRRIWRTYSGAFDAQWKDEFITYDGLSTIVESDLATGNTLRRYFTGLGINVTAAVEVDQDNDGITDGGADITYVPLNDDRGTVMGVADGQGNVLERLYYNTTGVMKSYSADGSTQNTVTIGADPARNIGRSQFVRFGWTGMYKEPFTGLYHTHYREFDPVHNRWLSEDPSGYQDGLNLYRMYAGINGRDALGLWNKWERKLEPSVGTAHDVFPLVNYLTGWRIFTKKEIVDIMWEHDRNMALGIHNYYYYGDDYDNAFEKTVGVLSGIYRYNRREKVWKFNENIKFINGTPGLARHDNQSGTVFFKELYTLAADQRFDYGGGFLSSPKNYPVGAKKIPLFLAYKVGDNKIHVGYQYFNEGDDEPLRSVKYGFAPIPFGKINTKEKWPLELREISSEHYNQLLKQFEAWELLDTTTKKPNHDNVGNRIGKHFNNHKKGKHPYGTFMEMLKYFTPSQRNEKLHGPMDKSKDTFFHKYKGEE